VALLEDRAQVGPFDVARDGTVVFSSSNPVTPGELYLLRQGRVTRLTGLNSEAIRDWDLVQPEVFHFRSFDGTNVEGFLYAPARKAPVVLSIHGGPHGMLGYAFTGAFQLNASRGYATVAINPRGSSGYGQRFSDGCVNDWGGGDYRDLMAGLDYVLETHPALDRTRLAVRGGSYGGYMTNWVITQTQRFKAAVSLAGLSNLISFYGTSLYQDLMHAEFGGFPWAGGHYDLLWQRSPLRDVERVTTPTLFLHGEQDNDVPITQAEEMYVALRRRGVESMLVRYPREGHGFHEPKHQLDSTLRELEWLDRFLK
jgi:dipeptidyl aminopeptidase/acylaminoacyl peptidase